MQIIFTRLYGLVLRDINQCRLFNVKSGLYILDIYDL